MQRAAVPWGTNPEQRCWPQGAPQPDVPVPAPRKAAPAAALSSEGWEQDTEPGSRVNQSIPEGPQQHGPRPPDPATPDFML